MTDRFYTNISYELDEAGVITTDAFETVEDQFKAMQIDDIQERVFILNSIHPLCKAAQTCTDWFTDGHAFTLIVAALDAFRETMRKTSRRAE